MMKKIRSHCNRTTLFFFALFAVGILTIIPYGACLDQSTEQYILYSNIKEYLLHMPGNHEDMLKSLTDAGVEEISISNDRYNGMAVYYPAFPIWYLNKVSPYLGNICWHICIFLLVFWGIISLFKLVSCLFGDKEIVGFTTMLFLMTPRMFSECHYNNKDMVVLSLTFVLMYRGMRLMTDKSPKNVCAFAAAGALLSNMKIIGVWIFGVLGLYILAYFILTKQFDRTLCIKAVFCVALYGVVYLLITPASWNDGKGFFEFLISCATDFRWHDYLLFRGNMYNKDNTGIPRSYLPVMMLTTIPVGILLLGMLGAVASIADCVREKIKCLKCGGYVAVCGAAGGVPLLYAVAAATPVYNGWRHFYFVYASVILAMAYGIYTIKKFLEGKRLFKAVRLAGVLYIAFLSMGIALNYPQNHSYYNLLAGNDVISRFELDYWGLSTKQAYEKILGDTDKEFVTVGALNNPTRWSLEENLLAIRGKQRMRLEIAGDWRNADYLIINTTYAHMYSQNEYETVRNTYTLVDSISSYGNVICEIYQK